MSPGERGRGLVCSAANLRQVGVYIGPHEPVDRDSASSSLADFRCESTGRKPAYAQCCRGIRQLDTSRCVVTDDSNLESPEPTVTQGERGQSTTVDLVRLEAEACAGRIFHGMVR